jgi:hypothetical protein
MTIRNKTRLFALSLCLTAGFAALPAAAEAQQQAMLTLPSQIPAGTIRIPCCRCLDGHTQRITLDTRTAAWKVALPGSTNFQPVVPANNGAWVPVPPAGWVGPAGSPLTPGNYVYQIQFYVPPCTITPRVSIAGRFAADNSGTLLLDGQPIAVSLGALNVGYVANAVTPFTRNVGSGLHTLQLRVFNREIWTGMVLQGAITVTCPENLEQGPRELEATSNNVPREMVAEPPR